MEYWRGFRYQTGEIDELVEALRRDKNAQADIDYGDEIEVFNAALAEKGIHIDRSVEPDYRAVDLNENPDFFSRLIYDAPFGRVSIDYFLVDQKEESYADIFLD